MKTLMHCALSLLLLAWVPIFSDARQGTAQTLPAREITASATMFVELLVKEDFTRAAENFDDTMKAALPAAKLQEVWKTINMQIGPWKRQVSVRKEKAGQFEAAIVTGEFELAAIDIKVVFNGAGQIAGLFFTPAVVSTGTYKSPAYARPDSFREQEAVVGGGEWALPATLTLPAGAGPFPAVVLVHGSGPNDRDETIGPNKPFRDLAVGLASKGIAVLRYDKRTRVHGGKMTAADVTVKEETVDDAIAAVALLRRTAGIDKGKIFVIGHSLGGMLIPRIGKADPGIAGFIVMAANSRPIEDVIVPQFAYVFSLDGTISESERAQLDRMKRQVARLKEAKSAGEVTASEMPFGLPPRYWLDVRGYRPAEAARELKQPMLVLQGERDYQITMEDFAGWKVLSARKNVEFKSYPKLNHLFLEGEGKAAPSEYDNPGNIPSYVIDDIAAWIKRN